MLSEPASDETCVLIVDGVSDVGIATAQAFLEAGSRVAVNAEERTAGDIAERIPAAIVVPGEANSARGAAALVESAAEQLRGLDICIHFPPVMTAGDVLDLKPGVWASDVQRSLLGAHSFATAAAARMTTGTGGSIVLIGSVDAIHAYPGRSSAATAMAGLAGLVRALAVELAPRHVRVNLVVIGPLADIATSAPADDAANALLERTLLRSPMHRLGAPREAAAAVRFVAGARAGFMTGQAMRVDGGWASLNQAPDGMKFP